MWIASALFAVGLAAPGERKGCVPLEEAEFRAMVLDAQSAIDRGDVDLPVSILSEVSRRLPCLAFMPPTRMWADLLVAQAIVAFSREGNWQDPMAAALRIRPAVDRGVGPGHPLAHWTPPAVPAAGPPVPEGRKLYVDGLASPTLPPDKGLYLVQKTDGRFWNTLLLHDQALPMEWVEAPVDTPPRVASWGRLGLAIGSGSVLQSPSWESDVYPTLDGRRLLAGAQGDLQLTFMSPFGLLGHASVLASPTLQLDGWISAIWAWRGLSIGAGPGLASFGVVDITYGQTIAEVERTERLPYLQGSAILRTRDLSRWDLSVSGGASPAVIHYEVGSGLLLPEMGGQRYRIGLVMDARTAQFVQQGVADRTLRLSSSRLLLRIDWVRGEY
jgi:hypothetical protein